MDRGDRLTLTLGLASGTLGFARDHAAWAQESAAEKRRLRAALGDRILAVEHVGSTAVPGVPAKPILDIQTGVLRFEDAVVCVPLMAALGYEYRGEYGIPRRHYFVKGDPRTHHVHMLEIHGEKWASMLAFRDKLRNRPELARIYAEAKARLAQTFPNDRAAYQEQKGDVIAQILSLP
jgi:GrpB-like predicted nucleotidyltransferase (UPF0157 family)